MRRLVFLVPLVIFLTIAVYFAVGLTNDPRKLPSALIDKPVPEFDLAALKPDKPGLATADLRGEIAIVNVFASWCIPCKAEHPLWMRLAKEGGVPIHAINRKDERANAIAWLKELGDPYTRIGYDRENKAGIELGVYGVPETYIVDREGRIRYKHIGPLFVEDLETKIRPLLESFSK